MVAISSTAAIEHERRDADRDVGRDGERREQRLEVLQLVLDLFDALHARVNASMMTSDWLWSTRLIQYVSLSCSGVMTLA